MGRGVRSCAVRGWLDLFGERSNFDLLWRFELFGGIPCFLRSQCGESSRCRRLMWPKAIRLNGKVPIAAMTNGLGDARIAAVSKPSSLSMKAIPAFEDLVIVSVLFFMVNSIRVALRTKLFTMSRVTPLVEVAVAGHIGYRSIIGRTSHRIGTLSFNFFLVIWEIGGGFNEDIHLLADVNGEAIGLEAIYDLQDARIHAFRAGAGEGALRHDVGLETDELECRLLGRIAAHCSTAFARGSTRQASCSSTSTRRCSGTRPPRSSSGSGVMPAAANSPARTLLSGSRHLPAR